VRIVVDDEEAQAVEVDADHGDFGGASGRVDARPRTLGNRR
jgi:hypothetical protein